MSRCSLHLQASRLSAIMLGRLRMSADEALNAYTRFGQSVFGNARWWNERSLLYFPRAKYPSRKIRGAITEVIYEKLKEDNPKTTPYQAKEEPFSSRDCSRDHKTRMQVQSLFHWLRTCSLLLEFCSPSANIRKRESIISIYGEHTITIKAPRENEAYSTT